MDWCLRMPRMRLAPGSSRLVAVSLFACLGLAVTGVRAQVVRTFDQTRSTSARANEASRDNSVAGFGTWTSDLHVDAPGGTSTTAASATQTSGIYGDSTLAHGSAHGRGDVAAGLGDGSSNFRVSFLVDVRTGFTLTGRVTTRASAADGAEGEASAVILFGASGAPLASAQSDCGVNSTQPEPCDRSEDLLASGVLEPGVYVLEAHASAVGTANATAAGEAEASFSLRIWFDGPIVGARPAAWSDIKTLYR